MVASGPRSAGARDNDGSCVLLVSAGGRRLLLPGDIEQNGERELLGHLPRVDIVVVPHHGSRSSSSEPFVATTQPGWALVSAGYRNRWGFPRPEIVDRWEAAGAAVLTTAEGGALESGSAQTSTSGPSRGARRTPALLAGGVTRVIGQPVRMQYHPRSLRQGSKRATCSKSSKPAASSWCRSSLLDHRRRHHPRETLDPARAARRARWN